MESSFNAGDPPPKVPGLAAGSGVGLEGGAFPCPVYNKLTVGADGEMREARACTEPTPDNPGGCRRCWEFPHTPISYGPH